MMNTMMKAMMTAMMTANTDVCYGRSMIAAIVLGSPLELYISPQNVFSEQTVRSKNKLKSNDDQ